MLLSLELGVITATTIPLESTIGKDNNKENKVYNNRIIFIMAMLQLDPDSELQFFLSYNDETSRCTMTLRHPGTTDEYIAFKVKTTQPRRYLVRPNQGLVAPGTAEKVAILLVDKDKQALLKSYESLGQSALDHAKDKFLVQSCAVTDAFASKFKHQLGGKGGSADNTELYDALNSMWSSVSSSGGGGAASGTSGQVQNKKLHVRLYMKDGGGAAPSGGGGGVPSSAPVGSSAMSSSMGAQTSNKLNSKDMLKPHDNSVSLETMSQEQLFAEVTNLRRKYDELVSFSVNLTAERDILNNTLEQTKRELNREVAQRSALENKGGSGDRGVKGGSAGSGKLDKSSAGSQKTLFARLLPFIMVGLACFLSGVREKNYGRVDFLEKIPALGDYLVPPIEAAKTPEEVKAPEQAAEGAGETEAPSQEAA